MAFLRPQLYLSGEAGASAEEPGLERGVLRSAARCVYRNQVVEVFLCFSGCVMSRKSQASVDEGCLVCRKG